MCQYVSAECVNCYACSNGLRCLTRNGTGLPYDARALELGEFITDAKALMEPYTWKQPRRRFVCSQTDLFGALYPLESIQRLWKVMWDNPRHTFMILTKRSQRMVELAPQLTWADNLWAGVSCGLREYYSRLDDLRKIPAVVRFWSYEPALESAIDVDLTDIDWVIAGGESGWKARPADDHWFREIRDKCKGAGIPFFFKQHGDVYARAHKIRKEHGGNLLDGQHPEEFPKPTYGRKLIDLLPALIQIDDGRNMAPEPQLNNDDHREPVTPEVLTAEEPVSRPNVDTEPQEPRRGIVELIEEYITDYVSVRRPNFGLPISLWALATHCHMQFRAFGFLVFTGEEYGSAKTYMLEILQQLVKDGRLLSGITLSAMCSDIEVNHPTLLIDQAEGLGKEETKLMRVMQSGYKQGATYTVRQGNSNLVRSVYGPKAFALIGDLPRPAMDRSIAITMERRTPKKVRDENEGDWNERGERIRTLAAVAITIRKQDIDTAVFNFRAPEFLNGREIEIWKPLLVMCGLFAPNRRAELEQTAVDLSVAKLKEGRKITQAEAIRRAETRTYSERLVKDIYMLCGEEHGIRTEEALERLKQLPNNPWRNYADVGLRDIKMAQLLKAQGIRSRQMKMHGINRNSYLKADLEQAVNSFTAQACA